MSTTTLKSLEDRVRERLERDRERLLESAVAKTAAIELARGEYEDANDAEHAAWERYERSPRASRRAAWEEASQRVLAAHDRLLGLLDDRRRLNSQAAALDSEAVFRARLAEAQRFAELRARKDGES